MVTIEDFDNPNKYCTGHIGDMSLELRSIYNRTFRPFDDLGDVDDVKDYIHNLSYVGFISKEDDLLQIYRKDCDFLESRDVTYKQIADKLRYIVDKYKQIRSLKGKDNDFKSHHNEKIRSLNVDWETKTNNGFPYGRCTISTLKHVIEEAILIEDTDGSSRGKYLVVQQSSWGYQSCPFRSPKDKEGIFFGRAATGGGDDYWVYDIQTSNVLSFNDLHIHMIAEHGFFQGSVPYRLDPQKVIEFFDLQSGVDYSCKYRLFLQWKSEHVSGSYDTIPKGSEEQFEINHTQPYKEYDAPLLDRFISFPSDLPNVASVNLIVKQIKDTSDITTIVHGVPLIHKFHHGGSQPEGGFKYNLKYQREIMD